MEYQWRWNFDLACELSKEFSSDNAAKSAQFFDGSGVYMVSESDRTMIYKCERRLKEVYMHSNNKAYPTRIVSLEWFDEHVTGQVVGVSRAIEKVWGFDRTAYLPCIFWPFKPLRLSLYPVRNIGIKKMNKNRITNFFDRVVGAFPKASSRKVELDYLNQSTSIAELECRLHKVEAGKFRSFWVNLDAIQSLRYIKIDPLGGRARTFTKH
jgi:hypothetical protein